MAGIDINSEIESDSDSVLELDITSGLHGSSSEEELYMSITENQPETEETEIERTIRSRLGHREWCICSNCQVMSTEGESICCQEMDVLGDRLDLKGRK